jgi:hypothetical protein
MVVIPKDFSSTAAVRSPRIFGKRVARVAIEEVSNAKWLVARNYPPD